MPRRVDVEERRRQVVDAVWRVVLRDGLDRATTRRIAAEAGLSLGAITHWFPSQSSVYEHVLVRMEERSAARLAGLSESGSAREVVERFAWASLPVDPDTREEAQVYYAFLARARVTPALRAIATEIDDAAIDAVRGGAEALRRAGEIAGGHDLDVVATHFHALTEGLSFQAAMWPERWPADRVKAAFQAFLDSLRVPPP